MDTFCAMRSGKAPLEAVWKALDEAAFGAAQILNLRESLPTVADARFRAEAWLRERQVQGAKEVLLITGRGNNSPGGVSPVREGILSLLAALRRRGVVSEWREHNPGSFAVRPAPVSALLSAPKRRNGRADGVNQPVIASLQALEPETIALLRRLAQRSLEALGVRESEKFVEGEMTAKFNSLAGGVTPGVEGEARLREAIRSALEDLDG